MGYLCRLKEWVAKIGLEGRMDSKPKKKGVGGSGSGFEKTRSEGTDNRGVR